MHHNIYNIIIMIFIFIIIRISRINRIARITTIGITATATTTTTTTAITTTKIATTTTSTTATTTTLQYNYNYNYIALHCTTLHPAVVVEVTTATTPQGTTPTTFRSISGFTLPSMPEFPIFETSASALCGTSGIIHIYINTTYKYFDIQYQTKIKIII